LEFLYAIPFGVWLFLGIEELPLAAEEAAQPIAVTFHVLVSLRAPR
jgi:hypothetical protein